MPWRWGRAATPPRQFSAHSSDPTARTVCRGGPQSGWRTLGGLFACWQPASACRGLPCCTASHKSAFLWHCNSGAACWQPCACLGALETRTVTGHLTCWCAGVRGRYKTRRRTMKWAARRRLFERALPIGARQLYECSLPNAARWRAQLLGRAQDTQHEDRAAAGYRRPPHVGRPARLAAGRPARYDTQSI